MGFIKKLKEHLFDNKHKFVVITESETNYGSYMEYQDVDMDLLNKEIDEFVESFNGPNPTALPR